MLRSLIETTGYRIETRDETLGKVKDYYFHPRHWEILYLVADTGRWLPGKEVLVSPQALEQPEWPSQKLPVNLTKEELKNSKPSFEELPVSREKEARIAQAVQWPMGWVADRGQGAAMLPLIDPLVDAASQPDKGEGARIRSAKEVKNYRIHAEDGRLGHIDEFIFEDEDWQIRYLVADTKSWVPASRKVLLSVEWADKIDWALGEIFVNLPKEKIKEAPEFDPNEPVNRKYEARLYDYYGRPAYWEKG